MRVLGIIAIGLLGLLSGVQTGVRAEEPTVAPDTFPHAEEHAAAIRRMDVMRQQQGQLFREEFEAAQRLSVRERLERAANVTGDMEALAEKLPEREPRSRYAIYPRASHVARVIAARPWLRDDPDVRSLDLSFVHDTTELRWPTKADQEQLRSLLEDGDPDIRAMAVEALATLYDPEDLSAIAGVNLAHNIFDDSERLPIVPMLEFGTRFNTGQQAGGWANREVWPIDADPLVDPTFWQQRSLGQCVDRALRQLTGADVTRETAQEWIQKHGATTDSLWYWEYRMHREYETLGYDPDKVATWRKTIRAELAELDPLTEAKVVLLHRHYRDQGSHDPGYLDSSWLTRLTKDELLQCLSGDRLWDDVDWANDGGQTWEMDSQLATRIMRHARSHFKRSDVPQLMAMLERTKLNLTSYGRDAWHVGISQLLPAATAQSVDDLQTRDGYLRNALRTGAGGIGLVEELVSVDVANNREFLHTLFFQENTQRLNKNSTQASILEELRRAPLTPEKQQLLWAIVLDERFLPIWGHLRPLKKGKGDGDHPSRRWAVASINAHAGKEYITDAERLAIGVSETSQATVELILARLKAYQPPPLFDSQ